MKKQILVVAIGLFGLGVSWAPVAYEVAVDRFFPASVTVSTDLTSLVPAGSSKQVGEFVRDMGLIALSADKITTTDQLREACRIASETAQKTGALPSDGLAKFSGSWSDKQIAVLGKDSQPLTQDLRNKFSDLCKSTAADFGVK